MSLKSVYQILQNISNTSKSTEKIKIIKENSNNSEFKRVVFYALDYNKVYNISSVEFISSTDKHSNDEIFKFLDFLNTKNGATNEEKHHLNVLSSSDRETADVVTRIVRKDLRCGASIKTFLKVFSDLPYFEMMTCQSDLDKFLKLTKTANSPVFWSQKKDGVRTWGINTGKGIKYISRSGLSYYNFGLLDDEIRRLSVYIGELGSIPYETPIDGEMIVEGGDFQEIMKNVRTLEDRSQVNFQFNIFDIAMNIPRPFKDRFHLLKSAFSMEKFKHLKLLDHKVIESPTQEKVLAIMNTAVKGGDEGIVLKSGNSPYEFREKSKFWCKVKPVETFDLLVVGTYSGKTGKKFENTLGGLIVKFHDKEVRVGSGYSEEEREEFLKNTPKMIEVDCKGITHDGSLREPRFIRVRDDKLTTTDRS